MHEAVQCDIKIEETIENDNYSIELDVSNIALEEVSDKIKSDMCLNNENDDLEKTQT